VISAKSAMSKLPDGRPVEPKMTFAGTGLSLTWMPIDFSSAFAIASVVARGAFPDVHDQLIVAGRPEHVQIFELPALTDVGPFLQCAARSDSAFFGSKFQR